MPLTVCLQDLRGVFGAGVPEDPTRNPGVLSRPYLSLDVGGLVTPELTTAATDRGAIAAAALDLVDALLTGDRPPASRERDTGGPRGAAAPGAGAGGRPRRTVEPYLVARGSA